MRILCYVGPWCEKQLQVVAKGVEENAELLNASVFKASDQSGLASRYYELVGRYLPNSKTLSHAEIDMIKRCRLLRSLKPSEARKHLGCMRLSVNEVFCKFKPDLVISETVDSFVIDSIRAEAESRNIRFVGLVPSFVNGYLRVTSRGERNELRFPSNDEVERVLEMLEGKQYRPSFLNRSKSSPFFSVTKRWGRNILAPSYFFLKRFLSRERYNNHYWGGQIVASQWFHCFPRFHLGDPEWEISLKEQKKPVIYLPLQHIPEATVDYWCEDLSVIEYDDVLVNTIKQLSPKFHFLIKEHPNVLGSRNPKLYKKIESLPEVTFCPTFVDSNELVGMSDAVLAWTGTVGFEAALRGKPVLLMSDAYYTSGEKFKVISKNISNDEIERFINSQKRPISEEEKKRMVSTVLKGLLPIRFKNDGSWKEGEAKDVEDAKRLGESIRSAVFLN